jgi:hypothetical protein
MPSRTLPCDSLAATQEAPDFRSMPFRRTPLDLSAANYQNTWTPELPRLWLERGLMLWFLSIELRHSVWTTELHVTSSSSTLGGSSQLWRALSTRRWWLNRVRWESSSEEVSYSSASRFYRSSLRLHFYTDLGPFRDHGRFLPERTCCLGITPHSRAPL